MKDKKKVISVDSKKAYTTLYDLGNGKFGAMIYNYQKDTNQLKVSIADGYKVTKSLFGKVENGVATLDRNYIYFEVSK